MIDDLDLPDHVHAERLTSTSKSTGMEVRTIALWTDRARDTCERCPDSVPRTPACPVVLNGTTLEVLSQECDCGECNIVNWAFVGDDDPDEVLAVARELRRKFDEECEEEREAVRAWLRRELREVQIAWNKPLEPGETVEQRVAALTTGKLVHDWSVDIERENDEWTAALPDPTVPDPDPRTSTQGPEGIVVRERDLEEPRV